MRRRHSAAIGATSTPARLASFAATLALFASALAAPGAATAQKTGLEVQGFASLMYATSLQGTRIQANSFGDGTGLDFRAGFQPGDSLAFTLGYQWQTGSEYDTHFFPVGVRAYTPTLGERVRFYGEGAIGLFFSRLSGRFGQEENQKASAYQVGGGVELDIVDNWSAVLDANYTRGLGAADDYEAGVLGVGIVYRWEL